MTLMDLLGICAIDYLGDEQQCPNVDTPGLIVDSVSCLKQPHIYNLL
jgi:hypothetical protein